MGGDSEIRVAANRRREDVASQRNLESAPNISGTLRITVVGAAASHRDESMRPHLVESEHLRQLQCLLAGLEIELVGNHPVTRQLAEDVGLGG